MAPASRRRILSTQTLSSFGASPLYPSSAPRSFSPPPSSTCKNTTTTSRPEPPVCPRELQPNSTHYPVPPQPPPSSSVGGDLPRQGNHDAEPHGIRVGKWKIITQNSSIGDEKGMEKLTLLLEEIADADADGAESNLSTKTGKKSKRRLCVPEITFLDAFLSLQFDGRDGEKNSELKFTAGDALVEWAEAHRYLGCSHSNQINSNRLNSHYQTFRGVSILKTIDADAWANRVARGKERVEDSANSHPNSEENGNDPVSSWTSTEFFYDWTFASPYAGTIHCPSNEHKHNSARNNNRQIWKSLPQSHIPFHLLQDTSQPILLFDDIMLYEDDLHDNGEVSLNVKLRVMPTCWYILQRLFVRVDYVCIKCREVRICCSFEDVPIASGVDGLQKQKTQSTQQNFGKIAKSNTIYRDVTWREAAWEELGELGLPKDPKLWRDENGGNNALSQNPLAALLMKLPLVPLPNDLPAYSCVEV
eukprot:CAMPEP_0171352066 /NCGR_PEP_ID=MMETSP0878-20121228/40529_1 /TAXON_ID=67004 /ORGANISM="Thalassiosira weissflogii, Strain CCMP1336" /LENGTH=474 /DNA_ID=CAMNT_0011857533 /DNA_START=31 /DNA_END=1455 /DNA_ORIENTATION=+